MQSTRKPPQHLSLDCQLWWATVMEDYQLDEHHVRLLTMACESWDINEKAREEILLHGILVKDDRGNLRTNPAVAIAKDAKTTFARLIRELDLDIDPPSDNRVGPPALRSNRRLPF